MYGGPLIESEERAEHTASGTRPGLSIREALTAWRKSTTPSVLSLSNSEWRQMNVPVLPTPSLRGSVGEKGDVWEEGDRGDERIRFLINCKCKICWYIASTQTLCQACRVTPEIFVLWDPLVVYVCVINLNPVDWSSA